MRDFTNSQEMVEVPAIKIETWNCGKEAFPEMGWYRHEHAAPKNDSEPDFLSQLVEEAGVEPGTDAETAKAQMSRHIILKSRQMGSSVLNQHYMNQIIKNRVVATPLVPIGDYKTGENPVKYLPKPKFTKNPEYLKWAECRYEDRKLTMKFEDGKWVDK
jgi:hypothetical protein